MCRFYREKKRQRGIPVIMHADANSFYASCECLFRPDLRGKPVIVLSNNDSIIISLNSQAKAIGFKRGDRYGDIKVRCAMYKTEVFSSNYTLYADISHRIVSVYVCLAPEVEIYSIDECFLFFPDLKKDDCIEIARTIRWEIKQQTGITVSIGIAPTKTLAKFCNARAKSEGVFHYQDKNLDELLEQTPAGDIWGIGWNRVHTLAAHGVRNALQLKRYPPEKAKKQFTICGYNTVMELNGVRAIEKTERVKKQHICCSRQFGKKIYDLAPMEEALCEYAAIAVRRMRAQNSEAKGVSVYISTGHCDPNRFFNSRYQELERPTSFLPTIQTAALSILRSIYQSNYGYLKVMINLHNLSPFGIQTELFDDVQTLKKQEQLMHCMEKLAGRYGNGTLTLGISTTKDDWETRREHLSPCYTTRIRDLPLLH